jgi:hypothetical protein
MKAAILDIHPTSTIANFRYYKPSTYIDSKTLKLVLKTSKGQQNIMKKEHCKDLTDPQPFVPY